MTPQETANQALAATIHANTLSQVLPGHQPSSGCSSLGCSGVNGVNAPLDLRSAQLLSAPGHSSTPQFLNRFEAVQRPSVLPHGTLIPPGMHVQSCPVPHPSLQGSPTQHHPISLSHLRSLSATVPVLDAFDAGRGYMRCFPDEKFSSADKSPGSSNKATSAQSRWKPNAHQLDLLEQHFDRGFTRATSELHASVQGFGEATELNVNTWLKNRSQRHKRPPIKLVENRQLHVEESDDETPWEDFKTVSRDILTQTSCVVSRVHHSDVLVLARAIQDSVQICCYGVGKEALVMRAFASGLHHLGFNAFFVDDSNTPTLSNSTLVLISAGPMSRNRTTGMMDDAVSVGARVIVFAPYPISVDAQRIYTIVMPTQSQSSGPVGSDGEVMSAMPNISQNGLPSSSLFELSLTVLCDCVCVMLKKAGDVPPAKIRARHTNLEAIKRQSSILSDSVADMCTIETAVQVLELLSHFMNC